MKKVKKVIEVQISIKIPYVSYESHIKDLKAEKQIRRWIKETLNEELSYIPIYNICEIGIEDSTQKTTIRVKN